MTTRKKSSNNPLNKKAEWSITEFQMWLAGAYSLQGEDWIPNAEQWKMIVDIIYKLKERQTKVVRAPVAPAQPMHMGYGNGHQDFAVPDQQPMVGAGALLGPVDDIPEEANLSLSELKRRRAGGPSNGNTLLGNAPIGEKEIKTGAYE